MQRNYTNQAAPIRVASYNIRKCVGLDRIRAPERVLGVISALETDVIALQEADKRLGLRPAALPPRLIAAESDFKPVLVDQPDAGKTCSGADSLGWHGNAILIRKQAEVKHVQGLHLPGLEPRGALIAEIDHEGQVFRLVATHLGLMRRHRQTQLTAIREALDTLGDMPTILLGDFNEWSPDKGFDELSDSFAFHAPGHSFHAARPVAALDRIALGHGIRLKDAGVHEKGAALRASDHLPIWADISLPDVDAPVVFG